MSENRKPLAIIGLLGVVALLLAVATASAGAPDVKNPDLGFDDAYTQIVNHDIAVERDGKPTNIGFGDVIFGRYYLGPRGLEIRLNKRGTLAVAKLSVLATTSMLAPEVLPAVVARVAATKAGSMVLAAAAPTAVRDVLRTAGAIGAILIDDDVYNAILRGNCFGITVLSPDIRSTLDRAVDVMLLAWNQFVGRFAVDMRKTVIWVERCEPDDKSGAEFLVPPPITPDATDTETVTKAIPIPTAPPPQPTVQPKLPEPAPPTVVPVPTPTPAPVPPGPIDYVLNQADMTFACRQWDGYASEPDVYAALRTPFGPDDWKCYDQDGRELGGLQVREGFCDIKYPGSATINPTKDAYDWRCRTR
ncbi:hypothetical protein AB0425_35280 [Actinosynnema sp. NPDC051121]